MDIIIQRFQDACRENGINIKDDDIFCYMDDLTVALKPEYDPRIVARILEDILNGYAMKLNTQGKSAAISSQTRYHDASSDLDSWYPVMPDRGARTFGSEQERKQSAFSDLL